MKTSSTEGLVRISVVARETGLTSETLRKWEDRYGFPTPVRTASGARLYTAWQIERLREVKRQIDIGIRPAIAVKTGGETVFPTECFALEECEASPRAELTALINTAISALRRHDPEELRSLLEQDLAHFGLTHFVTTTVASLNYAVGETWSQTGLRVHEEHMYSCVVQSVLDIASQKFVIKDGTPRVLLTTLPGELHLLGTYMAKALFAELGANCLFLGAQTPVAEIVSATEAYRIDLIGLSFSPAFPTRQISPLLKLLRSAVPAAVPIWIGGKGASKVAGFPAGVRYFRDIAEAIEPLKAMSRR